MNLRRYHKKGDVFMIYDNTALKHHCRTPRFPVQQTLTRFTHTKQPQARTCGFVFILLSALFSRRRALSNRLRTRRRKRYPKFAFGYFGRDAHRRQRAARFVMIAAAGVPRRDRYARHIEQRSERRALRVFETYLQYPGQAFDTGADYVRAFYAHKPAFGELAQFGDARCGGGKLIYAFAQSERRTE